MREQYFSIECNTFIYGQKFNENTYVIFEGLTGFKEENGMVFPGLSLTARDNENNVIINYDELFPDYSESGLSVTDFHSRVSASFILNMSELKNPLHCELTIWDKKSDAKITARADLLAE